MKTYVEMIAFYWIFFLYHLVWWETTIEALQRRPSCQNPIVSSVAWRLENSNPVDTGRKLKVHKTFRRRPGRLLNVLCTFNLCPVSIYGEPRSADLLSKSQTTHPFKFYRVHKIVKNEVFHMSWKNHGSQQAL